MATVPGLFIKNLPHGISSDALKQGLLKCFPNDFSENSLEVTVFLKPVPGTNTTRPVAIAKGFTIEIEEFKRKARGVRIPGTKFFWNISADYGEKRNAEGIVVNPMSPQEWREFQHEGGVVHTNLLKCISKTFLSKINPSVFAGNPEVYMLADEFSREELKRAGYVGHASRAGNKCTIKYWSALEALQAILLLNDENSRFCGNDFNPDKACSYFGKHGLARKNGDNTADGILNIDELVDQLGYVPFDAMLPGLFDIIELQSHSGSCFKCDATYTLLGISSDMKYLAGVCECVYDRKLDVGDKDRALFWKDEQFTRLVFGTSDQFAEDGELVPEWKIFHLPLQRTYASSKEYRNIVAPILADEWKTGAKAFKIQNASTAVLRNYDYVETVENKDKITDVYWLRLELPMTKLWNKEKRYSIGGLTLEISIHNGKGRISRETRKTTIMGMTEKGTAVQVYVKVDLADGYMPVMGCSVRVTPKPVKYKYQNTRHTIKQFAEDPDKYVHLYSIINNVNSLTFPAEHEGLSKTPFGAQKDMLRRVVRKLNKKQKEALLTVKRHPLSVIQGPPGTGKTDLCSSITTFLLGYEAGKILGTAPSNLAVDNFASRTAQIIEGFGLPYKVLRIYSIKRESQMIQDEAQAVLYASVRVLHEEVRSHNDYLPKSNPEYAEIRKKLDSNQRYTLTRKEEKMLSLHIRAIEHKVLDSFDAIFCTVGVLTDSRLSGWNKDAKITTVILDEAAQLHQAQALSLMQFKQHRTVYCGDHLQLKCTLSSYSARLAGLDLSVLDWLKKGGSLVPWVCLEVQHRMHPNIRYVVSELTYHGTLTDAANIITRKSTVEEIVENLVDYPLNSRVVLVEHEFIEKRVNMSIVNQGEADLTAAICKKLLHLGYTSEGITVLSLYEAQREVLEHSLHGMNIKLKTCDSYQGLENNVIVLNMCRGNKGKIGFASRPERLNVALSRAKELLVIVCNTTTFRAVKYKKIKDFLELVQNQDNAVVIASSKFYI